MNPNNSFQRIAGSVVWAALIVWTWLHTTVVKPAVQLYLDSFVASAEESTLAFVRESFGFCTRVINGTAAWFVRIFVRGDTDREAKINRPKAWKAFWAGKSTSTFNAVIEQEGLVEPRRHPTPEAETHVDKPKSAFKERLAAAWRYLITHPPISWIIQFCSWCQSPSVRRPTMSPRVSAKKIKRSGSELFLQSSGFAINGSMKRRGFLEDARIHIELAVAAVFDAFRTLIRSIFMLKPPLHLPDDEHNHGDGQPQTSSSNTFTVYRENERKYTTSDAVLLSGYPLEEHLVTTSDGYVLSIQRLPRKDSRDVVFFQHGVLDTSLSWVSNGPQGSQALAAYDRGADVWLGNSRSNPPIRHKDPNISGSSHYWPFSINELATEDIAAQLDFIHAVKCAELSSTNSSSAMSPFASKSMHQRSGSDSALDAMHHLEAVSEPYANQADSFPPNEKHMRAKFLADSTRAAAASEQAAMPLRHNSSSSSQTLQHQRSLNTHFSSAHSSSSGNFPLSPTSSSGFSFRQFDRPQSAAAEILTDAADIINNTTTASSKDAVELLTPDRISMNGKEQTTPTVFTSKSKKQQKNSSSHGIELFPHADTDITNESRQPYKMQAVAHSLGGASLLMYCVACRLLDRPHRLSRLVLLSPAGFHSTYPRVAWPFLYIVPVVMKLVNWLFPTRGTPAYVPSSLLRYIAFKLAIDLEEIPALNQLSRAAIRALLNQDSSEWNKAIQMPHYSNESMPALSLHTGAHLIQLIKTKQFSMYDYGSATANIAHYGCPKPPNVADNYHLLQGLPVDLVAGKTDGVVECRDVLRHYDCMKKAGLRVTYKELNVGHLDVTFAVKDEVQWYVLSRLQLTNFL